jgi:crotonyl-CoA carboxylase/reductase
MAEPLVDDAIEVARDIPDIFAVVADVPLGVVPMRMHAWTIRRERHGEPLHAFVREVVDVPTPGDDDVLVLVRVAGVNYNGVWAAVGQPVSVLDVHKESFHIAGSDASGIVWAIGKNVRRWKVGDEVVAHCSQVDGDDEECNGGDPMLSASQRIWGYETSYGSFAQFTRVQATQLLPRPRHLTWAASACYTLMLATAYRMLFGHHPHVLGPGQSVLIWGGAGG